MTLLERVTTTERSNIDDVVVDALRSVPGAVGVALTSGPAGTSAYLVIDATGDPFFDAEEVASERLIAVRQAFLDAALQLLCLTVRDAQLTDLRPDARVYPLR